MPTWLMRKRQAAFQSRVDGLHHRVLSGHLPVDPDHHVPQPGIRAVLPGRAQRRTGHGAGFAGAGPHILELGDSAAGGWKPAADLERPQLRGGGQGWRCPARRHRGTPAARPAASAGIPPAPGQRWDGDWLKAEGTSLGGDDGAAAAMMMALLDSNGIPHPPIEAVFPPAHWALR